MDRTDTSFLESLPHKGIFLGMEILLDPVDAFRSAQVWEISKSKGVECFGWRVRFTFATKLFIGTSLGTAHDPRPKSEGMSALDMSSRTIIHVPEPSYECMSALDTYLGVFSRLLQQWRAAGQDPLRWWTDKDNQDDVRRVQNAHINTGTSLGIGLRKQPVDGWRLGRKVVKSTPLLRHQRSLRHAASTAAYRLFGEALVRELKLSFCVRCDAVFACGKKTKFCSTRCAHSDSSLQSKNNRTRKKNRERVQKAIKTLSLWLQRPAGDWRYEVEKELIASRLKDNGLRKSQWLGRCIRASQSPESSPERLRLIEVSTDRGAPEGKTRKVAKDYAFLFALMLKAEKLNKKR
jgi:hypothetical protein